MYYLRPIIVRVLLIPLAPLLLAVAAFVAVALAGCGVDIDHAAGALAPAPERALHAVTWTEQGTDDTTTDTRSTR